MQCGPDQNWNYVLKSSADQRDFEEFRDFNFYKELPLLKTEVYALWKPALVADVVIFVETKPKPKIASCNVVQYLSNTSIVL